MAKIKKRDLVLLLHNDRKVLVRVEDKKIHSDLGILDLKKLVGKNFNSAIETSAGRKIVFAKPQFYDLLAKCKRGTAIILPKDFAVIVSLTGIGKNSVCVDIGTGSGWLAAQLANVCKKVTTYEIRKDFYELAKRNFAFLGLKNVVAKIDATEGVAEKNVDLVTVDVQEPWYLIDVAASALRAGGYFVAYCPQITQVTTLVRKLNKNVWLLEKVVETLQRSWKIEAPVARPEHQMLGHTGFLVVARKVI